MTTAKILSSSLPSPSFCLFLLTESRTFVASLAQENLCCYYNQSVLCNMTPNCANRNDIPCIFLTSLGGVQRYSPGSFLNLRLRSSNAATAKVHLVKRRQREPAALPSFFAISLFGKFVLLRPLTPLSVGLSFDSGEGCEICNKYGFQTKVYFSK